MRPFNPLQAKIVALALAVNVIALKTTSSSAIPRDRDVTATGTTSNGNTQCQEMQAPPDLPFRVVWNHPDRCERRYPMNFSDYGIVFNTGRRFVGDEIQTLYRTGKWPKYKRGEPINGGLPQLFNDTEFAELRESLRQQLDPEFTGLGVLDFESWRPSLVHNYGSLSIYNRETRKLVLQRHPGLNKTMVTRLATAEWETAAQRILEGKLAVALEMMPRGHWGYYAYPRPWLNPKQNNKLAKLWRMATGLYPSIYQTNMNISRERRVYQVSKSMEEAIRILSTFSPPNTAIYPYTLIQRNSYDFFPQDQLEVIMGLPADMGASGVVIWGSSGYYRAPGQCGRLQAYVRNVLGPYVRNLTTTMNNCSRDVCGGHGRCVHNAMDTIKNESEAVTLSSQCTPRDSRFHDYHCRCYGGWTGACCQTQDRSVCQTSEPVGQRGPSINVGSPGSVVAPLLGR